MAWRILTGDVLEVLRTMPSSSAHVVVTSPPYWNARDYRVAGQLGREPSIGEHVAQLVAVFAEVQRVLRPDGTLWLNYGDSYAGSAGGGQGQRGALSGRAAARAGVRKGPAKRGDGLVRKDLLGLPWRVAFALQGHAVVPFASFSRWADELAEARGRGDWDAVQVLEGKLRAIDVLAALQASGWVLRCDVVWNKPNPAPQSAPDRPSRCHESVFMLTRSPGYYFDVDAIAEPVTGNAHRRRRDGEPTPKQRANADRRDGKVANGLTHGALVAMRRPRAVWTIPTQPIRAAHFATFPERLARRCILASSSAGGACGKCGAPRTRVVELGEGDHAWRRACGSDASGGYQGEPTKAYDAAGAQNPASMKASILAGMRQRRTTGWRPSCDCAGGSGTHPVPYAPVPCLVLDPFAGAGTTLLAAERLGRDSIGVELSPESVAIATARLSSIDPATPTRLRRGFTQGSLFAPMDG